MEGADKEGASIDAGTGGEERDGGGRRGEIIFQNQNKKIYHCMKGFNVTTV